MFSQGKVPDVAQPFFCGATLMALPKPGGSGLRPVAAGEVLRRLVAKSMLETVKDDLRGTMEPIQMGVGASMGTEILVHSVRDWLGRHANHSNKVLVTLDLENAFNALDRSAIRKSVRSYAPSLSCLVDTCYAHPSALALGPRRLESSRGIQQGDPLGPALFGMSIHDAILQTTETAKQEFGEHALDITHFFLDDGIVAGDAAAVAKWLVLLETAFLDLGLTLCKSKCKVVPASATPDGGVRSMFPGMESVADRNFKLLGALLGSTEYCTTKLRTRADKAQTLMQEIACLEDSQTVRTWHCP
jgi:hypothetical protein